MHAVMLLIEEDDKEESWLLDDTLDTVSLRNEIFSAGARQQKQH